MSNLQELIAYAKQHPDTLNFASTGSGTANHLAVEMLAKQADIKLTTVFYKGSLEALKRFKDDAKEVATGFECGIGLENYNDLKPGDIIEAYQIEMISPELDALLASGKQPVALTQESST